MDRLFIAKKKYSCSKISVRKNIYFKNILERLEVSLNLGHQGFNKMISRKSMDKNLFEGFLSGVGLLAWPSWTFGRETLDRDALCSLHHLP